MHLTSKSNPSKNINELGSQGYEVKDYKNPVSNNIPKPETQQYNPTYKHWVWYGIDWIKSAIHLRERAMLSEFGDNPSEELLTSRLFDFSYLIIHCDHSTPTDNQHNKGRYIII